MAKEELVEVAGVVRELLPGELFRVKLETDHEIVAHAADALRRQGGCAAGDRVMVEMAPYDLTRGRITLRFN